MDNPREPRRRASLGKRLLLLGAAGIAFLGVAELVVRCLPGEWLGFRFDGERFSRPREFTPDTTVNEWRFHDVDQTAPRQPDVKLVVLLGDSYVEAASVPIPETVGQRLQYWLNAAGEQRWRVQSCGKPGWGQFDELYFLRQYDPQKKPDYIVTLFMPFNDVCDNLPELRAEKQKQYASMGQFRPGWGRLSADDAPGLIFRWSVLNQLISHRLAMITTLHTDEIPLDYLVYEVPLDERFERGWTRTATLIERTRATVEQFGARYLVVSASTPHGVLGREAGLRQLVGSYPGMAGREWDLDQPDRRLSEMCKRQGIPVLLLEPAFRRAVAEGKVLHWEYDGHWNAAGNDYAAEVMAPWLIEQDRQR